MCVNLGSGIHPCGIDHMTVYPTPSCMPMFVMHIAFFQELNAAPYMEDIPPCIIGKFRKEIIRS